MDSGDSPRGAVSPDELARARALLQPPRRDDGAWAALAAAAFAAGTETGYVTQFSVVPEPAAAGLLAVAIASLTVSRAVRRGLFRAARLLPRGGRGCS